MRLRLVQVVLGLLGLMEQMGLIQYFLPSHLLVADMVALTAQVLGVLVVVVDVHQHKMMALRATLQALHQAKEITVEIPVLIAAVLLLAAEVAQVLLEKMHHPTHKQVQVEMVQPLVLVALQSLMQVVVVVAVALVALLVLVVLVVVAQELLVRRVRQVLQT